MKMAKNPVMADTTVTKTGMIIFQETPDNKTRPAKIATKTIAVPRSLCKASNTKTGIVKTIIQRIKRKSKPMVRAWSLYFLVKVTIT